MKTRDGVKYWKNRIWKEKKTDCNSWLTDWKADLVVSNREKWYDSWETDEYDSERARRMILAEKITEERKKNGWSQEELAEQLSVSRQAVSKWESAQSIPDLKRVVQMAELFGVSIDYLLKEELGSTEKTETAEMQESDRMLRQVTMEEANEFMMQRRKSAPMIAGGVALCILSPAVLIFLTGLAETGVYHLTEGFASGIGLTFLLGMVAAAVFLFIWNGITLSRFEYLEQEGFETAYGISGLVKEKKKNFEKTFSFGIGIGVVLCIVAVLPLCVSALMEVPDAVICGMVSLLLLLVALGVSQIIWVSMIQGSYTILLQEGDYTVREKRMKKKLGTFDTVYWCTATAVYLGWSFYTKRWEFTWLVWPVAGVLYAAVAALVKEIVSEER